MSGQNFVKFCKGKTILGHKRLACTNASLLMVPKMLTSMITQRTPKWQCSPRNKMVATERLQAPAGSTRSQEVSPGPKLIHQVPTGCRSHQVPAGLDRPQVASLNACLPMNRPEHCLKRETKARRISALQRQYM